MNKKFIPIIIVFSIIIAVVITFVSMSKVQKMQVRIDGNTNKMPIKIIENHFQDSDCGMVINDLKYTSQVVSPSGATWFFHDHGGLINWLELRDFKDEAIIWVNDLDSNTWIDGRKAWYSRDERTPMLSGFGAYKDKRQGFVNFNEMRLLKLRGETMENPAIKKKLLGL